MLLSVADEFPADRCFTLVFRGRRGNLDLVAESAQEAQAWIQGVRVLMENIENMDESTKLDQYPCYKKFFPFLFYILAWGKFWSLLYFIYLLKILKQFDR